MSVKLITKAEKSLDLMATDNKLPVAAGFRLTPSPMVNRVCRRWLTHHRQQYSTSTLKWLPSKTINNRTWRFLKSDSKYKQLHFLFWSLLMVICNCWTPSTLAMPSGGGPFKYSAPESCQWIQASPNSQVVSVSCMVATIQKNTSWLGIQNDGTVSLKIQCASGVFFQSALANSSLLHLHQLKELEFEHCKLSSIPSMAFAGLNQLKNLTIRTHNDEWPTLVLDIQTGALSSLRQLERLDLSHNSIWSLPERALCSLTNLQSINLTRNRLQDIRNLGFSETNSNSGETNNNNNNRMVDSDNHNCQLEVTTLDVSSNDLQTIPADAFVSLRRLRELFLQDNQLTAVAERAFAGLTSLQVLHLSGNRLVSLPPDLFSNTSELTELYLSNNSIEILAPGLFASLQQLLVLDMSHNKITNDWVNSETFQDLIRLVVLNINHNKLHRVEASLFHNLYSLQILELAYNEIDVIADNAFASMYNLHTLVLGHNRLTHIDSFTLNGLYVLSLLSVDYNRLDSVHVDAFRNCSHLQDLHLNGNSLFAVPEAIQQLQFLKTLDLGENHINNIQNASYRGLQQLHGLRLIDNNISNLTRGTFSDMPALRILNLARNSIQYIEPSTFDKNQNLHAIRLDSNFLVDINGLFANLPNLMWLNISANQLTWFDYALIPLGLQWLDIHSNHIDSFGNYFELESKLQLQTMDASFNKIVEIAGNSIPDSIQLLFLNDNRITTIQPYTFLKKHNLTRVDLFGNKIETMDLNALRLNPVADDRIMPEFYMGGNPFQCDCKMEWLQRINNLAQLRQHPRIMDLESIYCRLLHHQDRVTFVPLVEVQPAQFLCSYSTHCFPVCHCCDFDACDCEMTCPTNCTCYHDQSWLANIVSCSRRNYSDMPYRIPMDATEVYLDGNNIWTLSSHSFIGRKNMKILYLNNSNIHVINNRTFNGLRALQVLHLEDNGLVELKGYEFERLENLRELHLNNNKLRFINNITFIPLRSLQILRLDGNLLTDFAVWNNIVNPLLVLLTLGRNPWSCNCRFMENYQNWLSITHEVVKDADAIQCVHNQSVIVTEGIPMLEFNLTVCDNSTAAHTVVQPRLSEDYLPILVVTLSIFAFIVLIMLVVFVFRHEMRVKLYSRYGVRLCHKGGHRSASDDGKLFDAFVSYSSKDENFVMQVLAPELEGGDPPYMLCLHYRDFPVGAYVSDTIVEAIESSSRTILILSDNFIKSEWCRFEFKSAHHQVLKDRKKRLVVILLGEVAQRDLDPDIRLYLKTNTYLQWGDKLFWEKLRFALPDVRHRNKHRDSSTRSVAIHI
ncbi:TIR [Chamberlinius hualienensis]